MRLTFYNHYGVGDLFESREFVKDWMKLCGVTHARYAHRSFPGFFADLRQIQSVEVTPEMDMRTGIAWKSEIRNPKSEIAELWVNTWIGARNAETQPAGDYVIWPGCGCTVEHLYRMHNDYLREAELPPLPRSIVEYIPTIDYTRIELGQIPEFLYEHRGQRLVLVCNGPTGSNHAANFDMGDALLAQLPAREDAVYLLTDKYTLLLRDDVFSTDTLTGREETGICDVNAISFLSRFCDVIVGRCSGAQMPCQVLENWMDSSKTLVCFTKHRNGACFVRQPESLGLKMKVIWSPAETPEAAAEVVERVLTGGNGENRE